MGVHWKNLIFRRGGVHKKKIGGNCLKIGGGYRQFANLRGGGLGKKEEVFLRGVDNPMRTIILAILCRHVSSFWLTKRSSYAR